MSGNFTAVRPHIYVAGAIIFAANHNDNENEIYGQFNASLDMTTGHQHTGTVGDGPLIEGTGIDLSGDFLFNINSTEISVIVTSRQANVQLQNLDTTVNNYQCLEFVNDNDVIVGRIASVNEVHTAASEATHLSFVNMVAGTLTEQFRVSNNGIGVISGKKLSIDGVDGTGNTYITESSADDMRFFSGGNSTLTLSPTIAAFTSNVDVSVAVGKKLFFDGGSNTSIRLSSVGVLTTEVSGADRLSLNSSATADFMAFTSINQTTGNIINIPNADSLTTGSVINIVSNSADTSVRNLLHIKQDNASATNARGLLIEQDSTATALYVQNNTNGFSGFFQTLGTAPAVQLITNGSSGSVLHSLSILGINSGAGNMSGIDLTDPNLDAIFTVQNITTSTATAVYGTAVINVDGVGLKRIRIYDLA